MATKRATLLTQLRELGIEHLGELNLLLEALHAGPRTYDELNQSIFRMAARSDRIPKARLYFGIAVELGIAQENYISIELTSLGHRLWSEASFPPYDILNSSQIDTLVPELLGHPDVLASLESALHLFTYVEVGKKVLRLDSVPLNELNSLLLEMLQAVGIASLDGQYIEIGNESLRKLRRIVGLSGAQTEDELWQSMRQVNERSREVEEYIAEHERKRLRQAGFSWLAQSVERVSKYDAKANYDIRSYDSNGSIRFIEVKSSTNSRVEFLWSEAERRFAKTKGKAYWIYFVPRAHELPNLCHGIVIIRNPHDHIGARLLEEATNFRVSLVGKPIICEGQLNEEDTDAITLIAP